MRVGPAVEDLAHDGSGQALARADAHGAAGPRVAQVAPELVECALKLCRKEG